MTKYSVHYGRGRFEQFMATKVLFSGDFIHFYCNGDLVRVFSSHALEKVERAE